MHGDRIARNVGGAFLGAEKVSVKTKVVQKANGQKPVEQNVVPGTVAPQQALQHIRNTIGSAVLFAWKDGTKTGLTMTDHINIDQMFEIVKAALKK